jgi:hypothetical protein
MEVRGVVTGYCEIGHMLWLEAGDQLFMYLALGH